jgi:hypothetical protein
MFPYPLQWGAPTFSVGHSFAMMSAVIVSMVEVSLFFPDFVFAFLTISNFQRSLDDGIFVAVNWCIPGSISVSHRNATSRICVESRHWLAG